MKFDQDLFEKLVQLYLNLPKKTVWAVVHMHAKTTPLVMLGYHRDDDMAKWVAGGCEDDPPERYMTFRVGDRMIDWWTTTGVNVGASRGSININKLRMRCTGSMADWWTTKGRTIGRAR